MRVMLSIISLLFSFNAYPAGETVEFLKNPSPDLVNLPIFFIGDNQFHNYLTDPTTLRNNIADKFVRVAIRPPLQDLFAKDLFIYAMDRYSKNNYVIHMGDALNISCKNEWQTFEKVMNYGAPVSYTHLTLPTIYSV